MLLSIFSSLTIHLNADLLIPLNSIYLTIELSNCDGFKFLSLKKENYEIKSMKIKFKKEKKISFF